MVENVANLWGGAAARAKSKGVDARPYHQHAYDHYHISYTY